MFLDTQSAPSMVFAIIPLILWQNEDMSTRQELWVHPVHTSVSHRLFTPLTPFIPWDLSKEETPRGEKALGLGSDSPWSMPTFAWSPAVWPWTSDLPSLSLTSFLVRRGIRLGLQMVKTPPAVREIRVPFLDQEDPLLKGMATHSSILAWRIPRTEEPGGLQSMGSQRVRHNWATNTYMGIREVNPYMCLSLGSPEFNTDVMIQVKISYLEVTLRQKFNCKLFLWEVIVENASKTMGKWDRKEKAAGKGCFIKEIYTTSTWGSVPLGDSREHVPVPLSSPYLELLPKALYLQNVLPEGSLNSSSCDKPSLMWTVAAIQWVQFSSSLFPTHSPTHMHTRMHEPTISHSTQSHSVHTFWLLNTLTHTHILAHSHMDARIFTQMHPNIPSHTTSRALTLTH